MTLQEIYLEKAQKCKTQGELFAVSEELVEEIMNTDERLYSFNRKWVYYGTWEIRLWTNEYHFGKELTEKLNNCCITTHDEDKEFTIEDFREQIDTFASDYLWARWE